MNTALVKHGWIHMGRQTSTFSTRSRTLYVLDTLLADPELEGLLASRYVELESLDSPLAFTWAMGDCPYLKRYANVISKYPNTANLLVYVLYISGDNVARLYTFIPYKIRRGRA